MRVPIGIANEGQMSEAEALAVLNVTQRRPKWLLLQVHPDKHPGFEAEATNYGNGTHQRSIKPWMYAAGM